MSLDESVRGRRPGLLVSVRSPAEALDALGGGAGWIDVKEPSRGALGAADPGVWEAVRSVVPRSVPFSIALGELADWPAGRRMVPIECTAVKIGLARAPSDWRLQLQQIAQSSMRWVGVAYADWAAVAAPDPASVVDWVIGNPRAACLLIDTADKSRATRLDPELVEEFAGRLRRAGKLFAVAGGLDLGALTEWEGSIRPDWFAVRGAACTGGDRLAAVDRARVAALAGCLSAKD
ncbi:MAG: (5-formylfuran-3-yl)methyl phosphate synthase [Isosphaeraceae bacterium]